MCGPIKLGLNGGSRYFIAFIDDFSRKTWIYFAQEKDGAFDVFKRFKVPVENEFGHHIKCLRIDYRR